MATFDPTGWSNLHPITFDNEKIINADKTDMPVRVSESQLPANFWSTVKSNGADLVGTLNDGATPTKLSRELAHIGNAQILSSGHTFILTDGDQLSLSVAGGGTVTATFNTADFGDISLATAAEVATVLIADWAALNATITAFGSIVAIEADNFNETLQVANVTNTPATTLGLSTDITRGKLQLFLKIPNLTGSTTGTDTTIRLYFGNPSGAEVNDTSTWRSEYELVMHDTSTGVDSTGKTTTFDITNGPAQIPTAQGPTGRFDGADDRIILVAASVHSGLDSIWSSEGSLQYNCRWDNVVDAESGNRFLVSRVNPGNDGWFSDISGPAGSPPSRSAALGLQIRFDTGERTGKKTIVVEDVDNLFHMRFNSDSTSNLVTGFQDGVNASFSNFGSPTGSVDDDSTNDLNIGSFSGSSAVWEGTIGSVRLARTASGFLDDDWIETEGNNITDIDNFYTVGAEQSVAADGAPVVIIGEEDDVQKAAGWWYGVVNT